MLLKHIIISAFTVSPVIGNNGAEGPIPGFRDNSFLAKVIAEDSRPRAYIEVQHSTLEKITLEKSTLEQRIEALNTLDGADTQNSTLWDIESIETGFALDFGVDDEKETILESSELLSFGPRHIDIASNSNNKTRILISSSILVNRLSLTQYFNTSKPQVMDMREVVETDLDELEPKDTVTSVSTDTPSVNTVDVDLDKNVISSFTSSITPKITSSITSRITSSITSKITSPNAHGHSSFLMPTIPTATDHNPAIDLIPTVRFPQYIPYRRQSLAPPVACNLLRLAVAMLLIDWQV